MIWHFSYSNTRGLPGDSGDSIRIEGSCDFGVETTLWIWISEWERDEERDGGDWKWKREIEKIENGRTLILGFSDCSHALHTCHGGAT